jgi:hypothetical protein
MVFFLTMIQAHDRDPKAVLWFFEWAEGVLASRREGKIGEKSDVRAAVDKLLERLRILRSALDGKVPPHGDRYLGWKS